jgi:hypothetical protein
VLYVGTDDAKLSVSTNSGTNWNDRTGILPQRYITDVLADKSNPATAYVTLSGYNLDEANPHVFRTTDYGVNWLDISGNLPDIPVNSIVIEYNADSILYVGTDAGVFYTENFGAEWAVLGTGLPNSPVFDLNYHQPTQKLVAGTHGRSLFEIDLTGITGIEQDRNPVVDDFILYQNYPNPFNPITTIKFSTTHRSHIILKVYDVLGNEIAELLNEERSAGTYSVEFDASMLASGTYFYKLQVGVNTEVRKMLLLK